MAWAVGRVIETLRAEQIDKQTLVLFLSDHGPHRELCTAGGQTAGMRGGKANSWEGGVRIPAMAWWPGTIKPGVSGATLSAMDLLPTLAHLVGADAQLKGRLIDGIDVRDYLFGRQLDDEGDQLAIRA
jgi:arylsulfatase A-like enzyme